MASKSLLAALAVAAGVAAFAAPTLLSAKNHGGGMMGDGMFSGQMAGFDFAKADADGDGKVTRDELAAYRQSRVGGADTDGDGMISVEELTSAMTAQMQARIEQRAKARVEAQDVNGDGKLSVEELIVPPTNGRIFDRLDADGDGAVSADELAAGREAMGQMHNRKGGQGHMRGHGQMGNCGMMQGNGNGGGAGQ